MNDKYFTPEIEDIRVGYECEIREYNNTPYYKYTFKKDEFMWGDTEGETTISKYYNNIIQTLYLTREQIEAEGWKFNTYFSSGGDRGGSIYQKIIGENHYTLSGFIAITIHKWNSQYGTSTLYRGECKDINTFRYICKLLNI